MIVALLLAIPFIIFLCWLLFTLAVYALPFFAGMSAGLWLHGSGSAAIAGYHAVSGLLALAGPSDPWHQILAGVGALLVGASAWRRLAASDLSGPPSSIALAPPPTFASRRH